MRIEFLADHPEHVATLARWHFDEWHGTLIPEWTYQTALSELESHRARAAIPTTFIALDHGELLGSASLVVEDLPEWKQLTPWMASVFVAPAWRGRGVGRELVAFAERLAGDLGVPQLYLLTGGQAEYYRRFGWSVVDIPPVPGRPVTIMTKHLPGAPR